MRPPNRQALHKREAAFWERWSLAGSVPEGFKGLPPISAYNPVAWLYRQRMSFFDAVKLWKAVKPDPGGLLGGASEANERFAELKAEWADGICRSLGRRVVRINSRVFEESLEDYGSAAATIERLCSKALSEFQPAKAAAPGLPPSLAPLQQVLAEARCVISPLLEAYRNPAGFFRTVAPRLDPDFGLEPSDWQRLADVLRTWGCSALLNPRVRLAYDTIASAPREFNEVLARVEGRGVTNEGKRPRGPGQRHADRARQVEDRVKKERKIRDDYGMRLRGLTGRVQEDVAREVGVKASAVRKSMSIKRKNRKIKSSK